LACKNEIIIVIAFLSVFLVCPKSFSQNNSSADTDLTLSEAILIAFQNNKDIQMQEAEIVIARANIQGAISPFLPQVNLQGAYTRNDKVFAPNIFSGY